MSMKKLLALLLAALMVFGLAACGGETAGNESNNPAETTEPAGADISQTEDQTPDSITIEHAMGTTEVSYAPERVCVLDSNAMDFMLALELTEYVTCVQSPKGVPGYLEEFYNSETIIRLERAESDDRNAAEEVTDPYESYYTIDADLIIGSADAVDAELYEVLSQIAPTIVTGYAIDHTDGMYAGVKSNARMIASIWGQEAKLDELMEEYDSLYQQLGEAVNGVTCVMMNSTLDSNRIQVVSNDEWKKDKEKLEAERSCRILFELGMVMYSNDAPEEVIAASTYERNTEPEAQSAKNQVIADWIAQVDPEYILIVDRNFTSVEEAEAEGCAYAELAGLKQYQAGKMFMLSYDGRIGASGLQGMMIQLNELAEIFLS